MHPAPSVILFTVLSGMGFGLLATLGFGLLPVTGWAALLFYGVGYALAVAGLLASTFHLGNPQRALRAFTQWRSSWLSREGWASVASLLLMAPVAAGAVFMGRLMPVLGGLAAVLCLVTVLTTSMIYAQLKTVPRWNHWTTPALFFGHAVAGGALLAGLGNAPVLLLLLGLFMALSFRTGDRRFADRGHTLATATGLRGGAVRSFAPPHTGTNYLMREMIHVVGRKHALKLRVIALLCVSVLPALVLLALPSGLVAIALAAALHLAGALVGRWLFFAEAEHVVGLYYGRR
ncbi:dimethyl sulfoxide reductase anchor subunit family protein [Albidovulum sediminicola]|uniref:Dimethyl sulfoxide reductase anchor subunit n=1 Tax=Albidovulum sediminicola TaxID=2984331 RepID=A0ABT2Z172_9RHOB|nr:DmsC/YnfH family molybdoenzyme membrane anchor subunit [Defluviimonas sp. WL0075]MCV2864894.1 dimethyl sulfoxide reductase anchor subunit [Defluviimonas sp. WL0075]